MAQPRPRLWDCELNCKISRVAGTREEEEMTRREDDTVERYVQERHVTADERTSRRKAQRSNTPTSMYAPRSLEQSCSGTLPQPRPYLPDIAGPSP